MNIGPAAKPSLHSRLARRVVLPLVLLWALGTAIALGVANHFAGIAFDRALLDDAHAVAAHCAAAGRDCSWRSRRPS